MATFFPEEQVLPVGTRVVLANYWPLAFGEEPVLGRVVEPQDDEERADLAEYGHVGSIIQWDFHPRQFEYHEDLRIVSGAS